MADDLRLLFIQAYEAWINAPTLKEKEITWIEYCQIRDLWTGVGKSYDVWARNKREQEERAKN